MSIAKGWAVKEGGEGGKILPNTVAVTRHAAIINWLVTEAQIPVMNHWTEERIEDTFELRRSSTRPALAGAEPVEVEIKEAGQ